MLPRFVENPSLKEPLGIIVSSLSNLSFMLILVSGVLMAFYRTNLQGLMMKMAPYGKMSLTCYITQSMVGSLLYYNWGLKLQLGITASFLVGVAFFILQFAFCTWWMRHHKHGPMEWLWKKATWIKL